jgi:hypothetical protein
MKYFKTKILFVTKNLGLDLASAKVPDPGPDSMISVQTTAYKKSWYSTVQHSTVL